jgi:hypothetical protein
MGRQPRTGVSSLSHSDRRRLHQSTEGLLSSTQDDTCVHLSRMFLVFSGLNFIWAYSDLEKYGENGVTGLGFDFLLIFWEFQKLHGLNLGSGTTCLSYNPSLFHWFYDIYSLYTQTTLGLLGGVAHPPLSFTFTRLMTTAQIICAILVQSRSRPICLSKC